VRKGEISGKSLYIESAKEKCDTNRYIRQSSQNTIRRGGSKSGEDEPLKMNPFETLVQKGNPKYHSEDNRRRGRETVQLLYPDLIEGRQTP